MRQQFFRDRIPKYQADPVMYAREVFSYEPDEWHK